MKRATSFNSIGERFFKLFRAAMLAFVAIAFVDAAQTLNYPQLLIVAVALYLTAEAAEKLYY